MNAKTKDPVYSLADIEHIIRNAVDWVYDECSETFTAQLLQSERDVIITTPMLAAMDQRLPAVVAAISDDTRNYALAITRTLEFWKDPNPLVIHEGGVSRYVTKLRSIKRPPLIGGYTIGATYLEVERLDSNDWFATGYGGVWTLIVATDLLDAHYPGFARRFSYVESLGMPPDEMAKHVFYGVPLAEALNLPGALGADLGGFQ